MFFNNLILFLVAIFVVSTDTAPEFPNLSPASGLPLLAAVYGVYFMVCRRAFSGVRGGGSRAYFRVEKKLSLLAVFLFSASLYLFDLKYYLHPLSAGGRFPVFENLAALIFFFIFLFLMWIQARELYQGLFHRTHTRVSFIMANMRANLPIIVPWIVLSLVFDVLGFFKIPALERIMNSPWGDLVFFGVFVVFLLFFFPPLVRFLWNCTPLPASPLRQRMESFCRQQNFSAEILLWPLFEGQVITAGIMGIVPGLRYLLVTPALLSAMNWDELQAVLGHEIGHVKKKHLLLYVFVFFGFSLFAGVVAEPLPYLILGSELFYQLASLLSLSPETLVVVLTAVSFLLLLILYFRYLFGYFIRNFERQADLHVFEALGDSAALISSFEKIALLAGNIRDQKSWHHFGLGERIAFLEKCERDRTQIRVHDRKVLFSLLVYFTVVAGSVWGFSGLDYGKMAAGYELRYVEAVLEYKLDQSPADGLLYLLLGDLMQGKKLEAKAIAAYEKGLQLKPLNPEIHNNLAWLLLTAQDTSLRDPERALVLARQAVELKESGYIFDTLAVALWANNLSEQAVAAELRAIEIDPQNEHYYQKQIQKMRARAL